MATKSYALKAEARERAGKGVARAIRREDKVPGVIYGDSKEVVTITLPAKEINLEYGKGHMFTSLCDLEVDGKKHMVLARDVQIHPVTDRVEHVDFLRVNPKTKIAIEIPVHFVNQDKCPGIKEGGLINVVKHTVEMLCSVTDIPDFIEADMTPFSIGDVIKISNAALPAGAKPVAQGDFTIATIVEPRREEVAAPAAAEGAAAGAAAPAAGAAKAPEAKADDKAKKG